MPAPVTGAIPSNPSPQVQAALTWFTAACEHDWDKLASILTDDYTHEVAPKSTGIQISASDKLTLIDHLRTVLTLMQDMKFVVLDVVEGNKAVVIHATSSATTKDNRTYANEYIYTFYLTDEGGVYKIKKLKEFLDSKYTLEFFATAEEVKSVAGK